MESTITQGTVFVIDDDAGVRGAIEALLDSAGYRSSAFASAESFLEQIDPDSAGCVIADLRLDGGMSGIEMQEELTRRGIDLPLVMITGHGTVTAAVSAFRNGAIDFLQKPFQPQELLDRVARGLAQSRESRSAVQAREVIESRIARLTRRERQIMHLLESGRTSKEVAADVGLSVRTVEGYRAEVLRKLEVASVAQMIRLLSSTGLVSDSEIPAP